MVGNNAMVTLNAVAYHNVDKNSRIVVNFPTNSFTKINSIVP